MLKKWFGLVAQIEWKNDERLNCVIRLYDGLNERKRKSKRGTSTYSISW
jgi:hypothetical protein